MHLLYHHRWFTMSKENSRKNIDASIETDQIDDDGTIHLQDGTTLDLVGCKLIPPEGHKYVGVLLMFKRKHMINPISRCPKCNKFIPWERPILLMEDGRFVYPCEKCAWVWEERPFDHLSFLQEWA